MFRALLAATLMSAALLSSALSVSAQAARPSLTNIPTRHDSELLFSAGKAWELHLAARPTNNPVQLSDATGGDFHPRTAMLID